MESGGKRIRSGNDKIDVVEELIDALTAAGNYLAVLDNMIRSERGSTQDGLAETLEKGIRQVARASDVARRLHAPASPGGLDGSASCRATNSKALVRAQLSCTVLPRLCLLIGRWGSRPPRLL